MKITSQYLHMPGMSDDAKKGLHAAVAYAEKNPETRVHMMSLADFCRLAKLPEATPREKIVSIMSETRRATASVRVVESSCKPKKLLLSGSWPVFLSVFITATHVSFEVSRYMWQKVLR